MKTRKRKRLTAVVLSFAMTMTMSMSLCGVTDMETVAQAETTTTLSNPTTDSDGVTTWDCIYFGNYWQDDTNGDGNADQSDDKKPIKWRVLSVDGDDVFLLADQNLDCQPYNGEDEVVTWETCTLRTWLNSTFLTNAFTTVEQAAIQSTTVVNDDNPYYGGEGGNSTTDQVYLLSMAEACNTAYGFNGALAKDGETREAKNTAYATACGAWGTTDGYKGNGYWWLRSPGRSGRTAAGVNDYGCGVYEGLHVNSSRYAVRPALHVNLSSSTLWSYAGKVTAGGGGGTSPTTAPAPTFAPSSSGLVNPTTDSDGVTTWDCIWFGNYWQNDTNGDGTADQNDDKEAIRWRVLSVSGDDAFLLADQNLDYQSYNEDDEAVTWEMCTLRTWLNGTFLTNAFTTAEQAAIQSTTVVNDDHPYYGTEGGNNTTDHVYLLSMAEASEKAYGFDWAFCRSSETRRAKNTAYATESGAWTATEEGLEGGGYWWLRSPVAGSSHAAYVDDYGAGCSYGSYVYITDFAVRPALHVNLSRLNLSSSALWSYAGKVTSNGEGGTLVPPAAVPPAAVTPTAATATPSAVTATPTAATATPTAVPTTSPIGTPTVTAPTAVPTIAPTASAPAPTVTQISGQPQSTPSALPPTTSPTDTPTVTAPTAVPTGAPTAIPTPTADVVTETVAVPSVQLKSLTALKKRKVKATWKKLSEISGYRLQYARDKKFKKNTKTKWLSAKKKSVTLTGLKKKKTYYIRIRAYLLSDGKKVYGKWSNVKKVKIKK